MTIKRAISVLVAVLVWVLPAVAAPAFDVAEIYGRVPLSFIPNEGQVDEQVTFFAQTPGYTLWFTRGGMVFDRLVHSAGSVPGADSKPSVRDVSRLAFVGANPEPVVTGARQQEHRVSYFRGNDPATWRSGIPTYAEVNYLGVYADIDLRVYGVARQIEYDWIVQPGGDPGRIRFRYEGVRGSEITSNGDLDVRTALGTLRHSKPVSFQDIDGERLPVEVVFKRLGADEYGFEVRDYDPQHALTIDPLVYSTYLGGSGDDEGLSIAVDGNGNAYITGGTSSNDFPTTVGAFQVARAGGREVFITKLNAAGTALVYSSFLGGSNGDVGNGIAVDSSGNAYITGETSSNDFPTTPGAFDTVHNGNPDAFITKLNASGTGLVYSTFLGGEGNDVGYGIAVDSSGSAYVAGTTQDFMQDFPVTAGAFQTSPPSFGIGDGFVTKLNAAGSALVYSTFLGGTSIDDARAIAIDGAGSAFVTGYTYSTDFPTTVGAYDTAFNGTADAFITKLNTTGSALVYSTYLGGSEFSWGNAITVDGSGSAYVTGWTGATDFPTTVGAFDTTHGGLNDAFVTKLNPAGGALVYSTFLGGSDADWGRGIAVDSAGNAHIAGESWSPNFPVTAGAIVPSLSGARSGFFASLNAVGSALTYSTYLGGNGWDTGNAVALGSGGTAFVTGGTRSSDFPTTAGAFQEDPVGAPVWYDCFVTKLTPGAGPGALVPSELEVDTLAGGGVASNLNGILEPGETVAVAPSWHNPGAAGVAVTGVASGLTGPGSGYALVDAVASYGTIPPGGTVSCGSATGNCYLVSLAVPAVRPALLWNLTFIETLSTGEVKVWTIHIGDSFSDVGVDHWAYSFIEILLHSGITAGCGGSDYCPLDPVTRWQMGVFLAKAMIGDEALLPVSGTVPNLGPYTCGAGGISVFGDVPPTDPACRHIHYIAAEEVTAGCGGGNYCPTHQVTRWQMGVFLAKAMIGDEALLPVSGTVPNLGAYTCGAGGTSVFGDIPPTDPACRHIHYIAAEGVTAGCGGGNYCPADNLSREQMAVFLVKAFGLTMD